VEILLLTSQVLDPAAASLMWNIDGRYIEERFCSSSSPLFLMENSASPAIISGLRLMVLLGFACELGLCLFMLTFFSPVLFT
jgi:hypothetical protein